MHEKKVVNFRWMKFKHDISEKMYGIKMVVMSILCKRNIDKYKRDENYNKKKKVKRVTK